MPAFFSAASLQVSITPAQGEVSIGESKFFLCEGTFANNFLLFSFWFPLLFISIWTG